MLYASSRPLAVAVAAVFICGCAMTGNYQSAKTMDRGLSSVGLTFGLNTFSFPPGKDSTGVVPDSAETLYVYSPTLIPEIAFHTAINDRLEIGGRVAIGSLGIDGDVKWGFFQGKKLFLALAPSIGGRAALFSRGYVIALPCLLTYQFTEHFAAHSSVFTAYSEFASDNDDVDSALRKYVGPVSTYGLSLGIEFGGEVFAIRPMLEFSGLFPADPDDVDWEPFGKTSLAVHLSWILGKEKQQLDRIEKKIDEKLK